MPDINVPMQRPGDEERFGVLFAAHRRAVLGYALRRLDDPADAADVVAETFLIAWRRFREVPEAAEARPWLLGVARRVLANQRRGDRRRLGLAERLARELPAQLAALERPAEHGAGVRRALARLSDADREVLMLAGWEGLTPAEIAKVLGCRAVTARSRLHRARTRLREELEGDVPARSRNIDLAEEPTA